MRVHMSSGCDVSPGIGVMSIGARKSRGLNGTCSTHRRVGARNRHVAPHNSACERIEYGAREGRGGYDAERRRRQRVEDMGDVVKERDEEAGCVDVW